VSDEAPWVEKLFLPWKLFSSFRGDMFSETESWPAKSRKVQHN